MKHIEEPNFGMVQTVRRVPEDGSELHTQSPTFAAFTAISPPI